MLKDNNDFKWNLVNYESENNCKEGFIEFYFLGVNFCIDFVFLNCG